MTRLAKFIARFMVKDSLIHFRREGILIHVSNPLRWAFVEANRITFRDEAKTRIAVLKDGILNAPDPTDDFDIRISGDRQGAPFNDERGRLPFKPSHEHAPKGIDLTTVGDKRRIRHT